MHRRSVFLINKKFQLRFSFYVCSWIFALSLVYPLIIYNLFEMFIRHAAHDPSGPPVEALLSTRTQVIVLLCVLQLLFLGVTFMLSIFTAHRIAGPLYKLGIFLERLGKGELKEELKFREGDHFQELQSSFNGAAAALRGREEAAVSFLKEALAQNPGAGAKQPIERAIAELARTP